LQFSGWGKEKGGYYLWEKGERGGESREKEEDGAFVEKKKYLSPIEEEEEGGKLKGGERKEGEAMTGRLARRGRVPCLASTGRGKKSC